MYFFERMEQKLDLQCEYEKIERIILNERLESDYGISWDSTINDNINYYFRYWKYHNNYISFDELRKKLGFTFAVVSNERIGTNQKINLKDFLSYAEMILNMFYGKFFINRSFIRDNCVTCIVEVIQYDLGKLGLTFNILNDGRVILVQNNPAAISVADKVECKLSDAIIEYNHYLLKGNITKKKEILLKISEALEPQRSKLEKYKEVEKDFFYMINNMNIRHNNCNPADKSKFKKKFYDLSDNDKEIWYDNIYQEGLLAFLLLESEKRRKDIEIYKDNS